MKANENTGEPSSAAHDSTLAQPPTSPLETEGRAIPEGIAAAPASPDSAWLERVPMLSIHPDAATRHDVANLASELMESRRLLYLALYHMRGQNVDGSLRSWPDDERSIANWNKLRDAIGTYLDAPDAAWVILRQALDDGAFDGAELATFGKYTVSWDTVKGIVAIADSGGWWKMDAEALKAIAAATPNDQAQRRHE